MTQKQFKVGDRVSFRATVEKVTEDGCAYVSFEQGAQPAFFGGRVMSYGRRLVKRGPKWCPSCRKNKDDRIRACLKKSARIAELEKRLTEIRKAFVAWRNNSDMTIGDLSKAINGTKPD